MKLTVLIFILIAYNLVHAMIVSDVNGSSTFPTMLTPGITFETIPSGCGGFSDCIEYVGKVLVNFVLGVVFLILLIADLLIFVGALLIYVTANSFQGINGAPAWLNLLLSAPLIVAIGIIIYKMVRKGDADDS